MVKYASDELFSITDVTKQLSSIIKSITSDSIEKIGILKNNKLEAVVLSKDEYEHLKEIEEIMEAIEHEEIYRIVQERKKTPVSEYISFEELAKKCDIDLSTL